MRIEDLKIFSDIVQYQSMTIAAEKNFITVQNISKIIKNMEDKFNIVLFHRSKKGSVLTEEGEQFYLQVLKILREYNQLEMLFKDTQVNSSMKTKIIKILCCIGYAQYGILGIFLGMIFAWCFGEIIWSSILAIVLASFFGFGVVNTNYTSAFGNASMGTIIAVLVFCYAVQSCNLLNELARWITSLKIVQKTPWSLLFGFYVACALLSILLTNSIPVTILLWALFYEIAKVVGIKPYSPFASVLLCGVAVISNMAGVVMPYCSMVILEQTIAQGFDATFTFESLKYMLTILAIVILMIGLFILVFKYVCRLKFDFEIIERETYKINLTKEMKFVLVVFAIMLVFLLVPNLLPKTSMMYQTFVVKIGTTGVMYAGTIALALIKVNGKPILNISEALSHGVSWDLIVLMGAALCISAYLTADGMGIIPTIVGWLSPLVEGKSALTVTLIFVIVTLIMSNMINDVVTATIMIPLAMSFVVPLGGNSQLLVIMMVAATMQGCFMASGSVCGALMHGNTAWLRSKDVFKWVAIMELIVCLIFIIIGYAAAFLGI